MIVDQLMYSQRYNRNSPEPHTTHRLDDISSEELYLCAPTIGGYSLGSKSWGLFVVDRLDEITWDENAFSHLVLDEDKKDLIRAIVATDQKKLVTDVITGKSGGFIVVLHGKPGTGKTLTAEAAAEHVQKPLLVVSAAELANPGPGPEGIEKLLRNMFDLASVWNAIVLIDEAEVYLEARTLGDVGRNAMVSIFLRLLEYHQLVMFLTTNHIERLDEAFNSRITVAVKYPELTVSAREEIWRRFLKRIDVEIVETDTSENTNKIEAGQVRKLAAKDLNGRYLHIWTFKAKTNSQANKKHCEGRANHCA